MKDVSFPALAGRVGKVERLGQGPGLAYGLGLGPTAWKLGTLLKGPYERDGEGVGRAGKSESRTGSCLWTPPSFFFLLWGRGGPLSR